MSGTLKYPSLVGGEQPASFLELMSTAGIGTTDYITFKTGAQVEKLRIDSSGLKPGASDGGSLGTLALMWSDLFLASGGVINWNNGNVTLTHSAGSLALLGILALTTGQLAFPATANPSADVNTLDDYEEGTFTPVLKFGAGVTGITYGTQTAEYVKVGKLVTITANITLTSNGSSTGNATITGLPFTSSASEYSLSIYTDHIALGATGRFPVASMAAGATVIDLRYSDDTGLAGTIDDTVLSDTAILRISGSYIASA